MIMANNPNFWSFFDLSFWVTTPDGIQSLVVVISILIGFIFIIPRYWASRQAAQAAQEDSKISVESYNWERFITSMENLRSNNMESKVAAVLAIRNFLEQNQKGNRLAIETLENYVRDVTSLSFANDNTGRRALTPEVQAILTLLADQNSKIFRQKQKGQTFLEKLQFRKYINGGKLDKHWSIDLSDTDLNNADLRGANLANSRLHNVSLAGANLHGANLVGADLRKANLDGAILSDANVSRANLWGASMRGASLINANLQNAILWEVDFSNAHLARSLFGGAIVGKAIFNNSKLYGADLREGNFLGTKLINSNLETSRFRICELLTAEIIQDDNFNSHHIGESLKKPINYFLST